jgi:hypothetical protein
MRRDRKHLLAVAGCAGIVAMLLAGCSSGKSKVTNTPPAIASNVVAPSSSSTPPTSIVPTTAATTAAASVNLSGSWSGKYSGAYVGDFTLNWQQSGSKLSGNITLTTPPQTLPLNGTVTDNKISFGTVGSEAITYSGTVSGNSMSGSYQIGGNPGGSWSATKS